MVAGDAERDGSEEEEYSDKHGSQQREVVERRIGAYLFNETTWRGFWVLVRVHDAVILRYNDVRAWSWLVDSHQLTVATRGEELA